MKASPTQDLCDLDLAQSRAHDLEMLNQKTNEAGAERFPERRTRADDSCIAVRSLLAAWPVLAQNEQQDQFTGRVSVGSLAGLPASRWRCRSPSTAEAEDGHHTLLAEASSPRFFACSKNSWPAER